MRKNTLLRYLRISFTTRIMLITVFWFTFTPNLIGEISEVIVNHLCEDLLFITNDNVRYGVIIVWLILLAISIADTVIRISNKNNREQIN